MSAARDSRISGDMGLPAPRHIALSHPVAGTDAETPSCRENSAAVPPSRAGVPRFADEATNGKADLRDSRLDAGGEGRPAGPPPATIVRAEIDPSRPEVEAPAAKTIIKDLEKFRAEITGCFLHLNIVILGFIQILESAPTSQYPEIESAWRRNAMALLELRNVLLEDHVSTRRFSF